MIRIQGNSLVYTLVALSMLLMIQPASAQIFFADFEDGTGENNPALWIPDNVGQTWGIADFPGSGKGLRNLNEGCGTSGNTPLPGVTDFTDGIIQLDMSWDDDDSWGVILRQTAADAGYLVFFGYVETGSVIIADLADGCGATGQCLSDQAGCENGGTELISVPHGLTNLTQDLSVSYTGRIEVKGNTIKVWYLPTADIDDPLGDFGDPLVELQDDRHAGPGAVGIWQESQGGCMIDNVLIMTGDPAQAGSPDPADGATNVERDVVLRWTAGEFANTHNVSLGTTFDDVNNATVADPRGVSLAQGLSDPSVDAGRLDFGETYYWRVDEVNGAPDFSVIKGNVWSFEVEPIAIPIGNITVTSSGDFGESVAAKTIDGSGLVDDLHGTSTSDMWISSGLPATIEFAFDRAYKLHELWVWNSNQLVESFLGFGAKDVVIETSLDGENWTVLEGVGPLAQGPGTEGYAQNNTIDFVGAVARHVRMTINSGHGFVPQTSLSEVRFFSIPTFATEPSPASGATGVAPDVMLTWGRNGREVDHHDIYVGSSPDDLALAGTVNESSFDAFPLDLQMGQTYHWRVDEVNDAMDPSTWTGSVWNFTTVDAIVIDDMESYADKEFLEIWATWVDGFDDPSNNGSLVGNGGAGVPETSIVNSGGQSLPLHYNNSTAPLSEATRTFAQTQDWTRSGVQSLVLSFTRSADSSGGGQPFVKVNDAKVFYPGDAAAIPPELWIQWSIDLGTLGTDLTRIGSLTVGIEGAGARGVLYVDDIQLEGAASQATSQQVVTWFEAEAADIMGASWKVVDDPTASGGKRIGSEDGDGDDNNAAPGAEWVASYTFTVPADGVYRLTLRAQEAGSDSFWVRIVGATSQSHEHPEQAGSGWVRFNGIEAPSGWAWDQVHSNDHNNEVVSWTLPAGTLTLEIAKREDGTYVDAIAVMQ